MAGGSMSEAEASERLQWVEEKYDLLQYKIDGWCVWPAQRFAVGQTLQNLAFDGGKKAFTRQEIWKVALRDIASAARLRRVRYVVKTSSSAHTEYENGLRKDIYFDDVLQALGHHYKIEWLNNHSFFDDGTGYAVPRDLSTFAMDILSRRLAREFSADRSDVVEPIVHALRQGLGVPGFTADRIAGDVARFRGQKRAYSWLFSRLCPKRLLLADSGDFAVVAAARELGIEVVEFQHGFTHRHFPGNSWSKYALPYKRSMPLPNRMFLYGEHWQRELAANGFWSSELTAVGSVRVDKFRSRGLDRPDDECKIVLTTQGLETDRVIAFVSQFVRLAAGRLRFQLHIKLHPGYHTNVESYESAFRDCESVHVVPASSTPGTFALLAKAHLHMSISSTCHFEALALGVPTVVLPIAGSEIVQPLVDAGHAFRPETPEELLDIALRFREHVVPDALGEQYFARNVMPNMIRELGRK